MCGLEVGSGPPTTTGLLRERQSSISRSVSACCGNIPPVKTRSAQAKSSSVIDAVLQSTRRTVQLPGNIAATASGPRGGGGRRTPINLKDWAKLQRESAERRG